MTISIPGCQYVDLYGPTTGDRIRLADTEPVIEFERDFTYPGDEITFGGGKVNRDGMGQSAHETEVQDVVITNAVIVDHWGIVKADIGIRDGRIVGIGKVGSPDIQDSVDPRLIVAVGTDVIAGKRHIVTAGGIDAHVHFISPQQVNEAISSGITTMIGGGTGPATGTRATTCTPGAWNIKWMLQAVDALPVNIGLHGKGNSSGDDGLRSQVEAGASGLKLHKDWGSTPSAINTCLTVGNELDVQISIHTDTNNEAGFLEDTIAAIDGRTIHTYLTEGAGGGHAPDIISIASLPNVLPSSTNPTRPYTVNTIEEHLDILMVCHHHYPKVLVDVAVADSRIRPQTIMAEIILHELVVLSMMSSDSQAMGRVGEVIARTWQSAEKMKRQRGPLAADSERNDNNRVKQYLAKYTINPANSHGIAHEMGSIELPSARLYSLF